MATAAVIALLAVSQWLACVFWVGPREMALPMRADSGQTPLVSSCSNVRGETVAVLMGLLTTLISLSRRSDDN